jgi:hypothetical protein
MQPYRNISRASKISKRPGRDTGVGQQIKAGCKAIVGRISKLRETQGTNGQARALSLGMASNSRLFNEGFVRFMKDLNDELTADTTYSPQEAWEVCRLCGRNMARIVGSSERLSRFGLHVKRPLSRGYAPSLEGAATLPGQRLAPPLRLLVEVLMEAAP